jgi:hypothetical protein
MFGEVMKTTETTFARTIKMQIEEDYEKFVIDMGMTKTQAINKIANDFGLAYEFVSDIVNIFEKEMNDIDHTGDLGEII